MLFSSVLTIGANINTCLDCLLDIIPNLEEVSTIPYYQHQVVTITQTLQPDGNSGKNVKYPQKANMHNGNGTISRNQGG